jgi:hypothetical protein
MSTQFQSPEVISAEELQQAVSRLNRAIKQTGVVTRKDRRTLLQYTGDQGINWSRYYYKRRREVCDAVLRFVPRRWEQTRRFIRVWVFAL